MAELSRRLFVGSGLLAVCGCVLATPAAAQAPAPPGTKYVCPPCGCDSDGKDFDAPGTCPASGCGMTLIPKPAPEKPQSRLG